MKAVDLSIDPCPDHSFQEKLCKTIDMIISSSQFKEYMKRQRLNGCGKTKNFTSDYYGDLDERIERRRKIKARYDKNRRIRNGKSR